MGVLVVVLVVLAAVLIWQFQESKKAIATTSIQSEYDFNKVAEIVNGAFRGARGTLWADTSGSGTINKRRRGKDGGIVMSIDIEPLANGGSRVDMWASQTNTYLGFLVNFAGVVNRRKKAIVQILVA